RSPTPERYSGNQQTSHGRVPEDDTKSQQALENLRREPTGDKGHQRPRRPLFPLPYTERSPLRIDKMSDRIELGRRRWGRRSADPHQQGQDGLELAVVVVTPASPAPRFLLG